MQIFRAPGDVLELRRSKHFAAEPDVTCHVTCQLPATVVVFRSLQFIKQKLELENFYIWARHTNIYSPYFYMFNTLFCELWEASMLPATAVAGNIWPFREHHMLHKARACPQSVVFASSCCSPPPRPSSP